MQWSCVGIMGPGLIDASFISITLIRSCMRTLSSLVSSASTLLETSHCAGDRACLVVPESGAIKRRLFTLDPVSNCCARCTSRMSRMRLSMYACICFAVRVSRTCKRTAASGIRATISYDSSMLKIQTFHQAKQAKTNNCSRIGFCRQISRRESLKHSRLGQTPCAIH